MLARPSLPVVLGNSRPSTELLPESRCPRGPSDRLRSADSPARGSLRISTAQVQALQAALVSEPRELFPSCYRLRHSSAQAATGASLRFCWPSLDLRRAAPVHPSTCLLYTSDAA